MSDTPRTDAQDWVTRSNGKTTAVSADFARNLERENSALRAEVERLREDKARLDYILDEDSINESGLWVAHTICDRFGTGKETITLYSRESIDAARAATEKQT